MFIRKAVREISLLLLCIFMISGITGCRAQSTYTPLPDWKYADLRALDPADDIPASQDLLALYIRRNAEDVEIRLDLLDFATPLDCDLSLDISSPASGENIAIRIPASGDISAFGKDGLPVKDLQPRVTRDSFLDTVVISLKRANLIHSGLPYQVTAYSMEAGSATIRDQIGSVDSDASPPRPAEALVAFWETFPAATPAQALRMWDGAHNGPSRSRYGLQALLGAVKTYGVPVALLDLNTPATTSILDYMGKLPTVKYLANRQLVILPDVLNYTLSPEALSQIPHKIFTSQASSPYLYTQVLPTQLAEQYRIVFISGSSADTSRANIYRWQSHVVIALPGSEPGGPANIPTPAGPSLALRRDLVQAALEPGESIFMLGGALANTTWGDPASVGPTLYYLSSHPWVHFLTTDDLVTLHPQQEYKPAPYVPATNAALAGKIQQALLAAPPGAITDLAWETYLSLLTPASPELEKLRAGYFGVIGHLLVAARWASRPGEAADCSADFDWDGQPECILASPDFLATIEPSGGYIVSAFARRADGVHQVIAPYSEFTVGLSDPSLWNPERGMDGDPALTPGGFVDAAGLWSAEAQPGEIVLENADKTIQKVFSLSNDGLDVAYSTASSLKTKISLVLDPWQRFTPGWGDAYTQPILEAGWEWALNPGPQVRITSTGTVNAQSFLDSRGYLGSEENPNFDYPPGHYVPFPLTLVEVSGDGELHIRIEVK